MHEEKDAAQWQEHKVPPPSLCRSGFLPSIGAARKLGELRTAALIVIASEFN